MSRGSQGQRRGGQGRAGQGHDDGIGAQLAAMHKWSQDLAWGGGGLAQHVAWLLVRMQVILDLGSSMTQLVSRLCHSGAGDAQAHRHQAIQHLKC